MIGFPLPLCQPRLVFLLLILLLFFVLRLRLLLWLPFLFRLVLLLLFHMLLLPLLCLLCLFPLIFTRVGVLRLYRVRFWVSLLPPPPPPPPPSFGVSSFPSLVPPPAPAYEGIPMTCAASAVPASHAPVFDPHTPSSIPPFEDLVFDPDDRQFDDETHFADPSAPSISLDSSRFKYPRMVEYVLGLFPQASGVPPSVPPPRALFVSFFADSTPPSPNLHFNLFDRARQSLTDADSRIAAALSSGRSDRVFLPSCHLSYAVRGVFMRVLRRFLSMSPCWLISSALSVLTFSWAFQLGMQ